MWSSSYFALTARVHVRPYIYALTCAAHQCVLINPFLQHIYKRAYIKICISYKPTLFICIAKDERVYSSSVYICLSLLYFCSVFLDSFTKFSIYTYIYNTCPHAPTKLCASLDNIVFRFARRSTVKVPVSTYEYEYMGFR